LAIRSGGRIQTRSLRFGQGVKETQAVLAWREFQENRRELLQTWGRLLREVNQMGQWRQLHPG
jgi:hypothetical protein